MSLGSIVVSLTANTGSFETDMGRAAKAAQRRTKEIDTSFRSMGRAIGAALGAAGAGMVLRKYIANTIEAEKVQAQLASRIKDTAGAAGRSLEQLGAQAEMLQGLTIFDDEAIGEAQAMLLTFKQIQGVQFDRTVESALDLATVMGTDASDAAKLLGKALADPEKGMSALSRAGVVFTEAEREAIKAMAEAGDVAKAQDAILGKLAGTMGSAAEAARNTLGGALQGLQNTFENLLEGNTSEGGLKGTVDAVNRLNGELNDPAIKSGIDTIAGGLFGMAGAAISATAEIGRLIGKYREWLGDQGFMPDGSDKQLAARKQKIEERIAGLQNVAGAKGLSMDPVGASMRQGAAGQIALLRAELDKVNAKLASAGVNRAFEGILPALPKPAGSPPPSPSPAGGSLAGRTGTQARAMPNFLGEDQDALRRMVEDTTRADEAFDRMAATLGGPLAEAEFGHQQALAEITRLGLEAGRSTDEIIGLKELETERYEAQRSEIEASLDPMQQLLDAMQAEIDMMGLSNAEKEMMNALRAKGIDLASVEAQAYLGSAAALDGQRIAAENALNDQITAMDGLRDSAKGFLYDLKEGEGIWDSLSNAARGFADVLFDIAAKNLIEQIFGAKGQAGGGGLGDLVGSMLGALFGGGSSVPGKASGGYTGAGGVHEVAGLVHREEVVWSKGDVARAGGVANVEAMRHGVSAPRGRDKQPIVVLGERALADALASAHGEEVVITHVMNNIDRLRGSL